MRSRWVFCLAMLVFWISAWVGDKHPFRFRAHASGGWVKYGGNPVLEPACTTWPACDPKREAMWDSWDVEGPSVLKVGHLYHMFYEGDRRETKSGRTSFNLNNQIGQATSPDGIRWTKNPRNPVFSGIPESDEEEVLSPAVLYHNGKFWMFYNTSDFRTGVYLAISADGVNWKRMGQVLKPTRGSWDKHGVSDVTVIHDGTRFLMWYTGDMRPLEKEEKRAIGLAWSSDGLTWQKYQGNPVLTPEQGQFDDLAVYDAWVIMDRDVYRMWYTCVNAGLFADERTPRGWHICYAWSSDGRKWTKFGGNPLLRPGDFLFERHEAGTPTVIREGNTYKMWYTGGVFHDLNRDPVPAQALGIGYATWSGRLP